MWRLGAIRNLLWRMLRWELFYAVKSAHTVLWVAVGGAAVVALGLGISDAAGLTDNLLGEILALLGELIDEARRARR